MAYPPVLPLEGPYTEAELRFIESSPDGFWPDNQDSYFGQVRKIVCDILQDNIDEITELNDEIFIETSTRYLSLWEEMLGLPVAPSGGTDFTRQAALASQRAFGLFSRQRRKNAIEGLLSVTFGDSISLTSAGVAMSAGGVPLFSGATSLAGLYRIYDDISNFAYVVRIKNTITPNAAALSRALTRITPAGIAFTVDNTPANVLKWDSAVQDLGPSGWWKLAADYNDSSGLGHNGTVTGAPTAIASPGLNLAPNAVDAARDFSGTAQYVTIADSARLDAGAFSVMGLVRPDALPTSGQSMSMYSFGILGAFGFNFIGMRNSGGVTKFSLTFSSSTATNTIVGTTTPVIGTTYHLAVTYDGVTAKLIVNGVVEAVSTTLPIPLGLGTKFIGSADTANYMWNGGLDEIVYLGYPLSEARMLEISNTTKNIP